MEGIKDHTPKLSSDDEALDRLLKEWTSDASVPSQFQETVWQRIERKRSVQTTGSFWAAFSNWIGVLFLRPALAVSYVTILFAIGVTLGWAEAREQTTRVRDELGQRYIRVTDPYQSPRE